MWCFPLVFGIAGVQLTDTVIYFGLAFSFLGSVTVRMPFSIGSRNLVGLDLVLVFGIAGVQLTDTVIYFGLAFSFLGSVTVRMPFSIGSRNLDASQEGEGQAEVDH